MKKFSAALMLSAVAAGASIWTFLREDGFIQALLVSWLIAMTVFFVCFFGLRWIERKKGHHNTS